MKTLASAQKFRVVVAGDRTSGLNFQLNHPHELRVDKLAAGRLQALVDSGTRFRERVLPGDLPPVSARDSRMPVRAFAGQSVAVPQCVSLYFLPLEKLKGTRAMQLGGVVYWGGVVIPARLYVEEEYGDIRF